MNDRLNELSLRLHSRYQPGVEADRYIGSLDIKSDTGYFILIEPGLGYLIHSLQKYHPNGKIAVLHADSRFREAEQIPAVQGLDIPTWYPDSGISVQEFLENEIPDTASIRLIEWRPSVQVYGEPCLQLIRESSEFIKRAQAGQRTAAAFGKRWVRNFFRNISLAQNPLLYRRTETPVVITGAGPSLEKALPQIRAAGDGIFIIAASSSLPALQVGGVSPDMVIGTDGGGWALTHLYSFFRPQNYDKPMLASPTKLAISLCAAVPSQCSAVPLLLLNDGSLWQSVALNAVGLPSVTIPQRGTVTASALDLAMILTSGNIFLAGMDLSVDDIKSHARPNGFDYLFYGCASRLRPVYSQIFKRSGDIKSGGSLEIYAAWFKSRIAALPDRIFSLGGNHEVFENSLSKKPLFETRSKKFTTEYTEDTENTCPRDCTASSCVSLTKATRQEPQEMLLSREKQACFSKRRGEKKAKTPCSSFKVVPANGSVQNRVKQAADALQASLNDPKFATTLTEELAPLLCPSSDNTAEIAEILGDIAIKYGGKGLG